MNDTQTQESQEGQDLRRQQQLVTKLQFDASVPEDQFEELSKALVRKISQMGSIFN